MHETIAKNLKSLSGKELIKWTGWKSSDWHPNIEQMGRQYIKRFGEPAPNAEALMVGYIIRDQLKKLLSWRPV